MPIELTSSTTNTNATQLADGDYFTRSSIPTCESLKVASTRLVPDAQGHVSREELLFANLRSLLSAKEPQLEGRFLNAFDQALNSEHSTNSTIGIVESALTRLIGEKLIDSEEATRLIQQASRYAESF